MTPGDLMPSGEGIWMMAPTATDYRGHALRERGGGSGWGEPNGNLRRIVEDVNSGGAEGGATEDAEDPASGLSFRSPLVAEELKTLA